MRSFKSPEPQHFSSCFSNWLLGSDIQTSCNARAEDRASNGWQRALLPIVPNTGAPHMLDSVASATIHVEVVVVCLILFFPFCLRFPLSPCVCVYKRACTWLVWGLGFKKLQYMSPYLPIVLLKKHKLRTTLGNHRVSFVLLKRKESSASSQ